MSLNVKNFSFYLHQQSPILLLAFKCMLECYLHICVMYQDQGERQFSMQHDKLGFVRWYRKIMRLSLFLGLSTLYYSEHRERDCLIHTAVQCSWVQYEPLKTPFFLLRHTVPFNTTWLDNALPTSYKHTRTIQHTKSCLLLPRLFS